MKRKLIVTLVASALELLATHAGAQAGCNLVGTATTSSAATPVTAGPLNPIDGFPEYVTDSTGTSVQRCLDAAVCFFDPVVATDPFSIQIGSGGEAFYWGATATLDNSAGKRVATVVMAAESAFLQLGPNNEPINGSQFPFLRLRFTIGVPRDGTYTVRHPYGTDKFTVVGATGARDVFATVDRGLTAGAIVPGPVGPWLRWDPAFALVPAGFLGNGAAAAAPNRVTGSPCGRNSVTLTGVDTAGRAVDFGGGQTTLTTNLFSVQGKLYDGRAQTPLNPTRLTYSRSLAGAGQIDNFAASTATAAVTVADGPTIPTGSGRMPQPLTLDHLALSTTASINSLSVPVGDASALPPIVTMKAADPTAATPTDPTTLNLHLVDFVDISAAEYDPGTQVLSVTATSSDLRAAPTLTLGEFGTFTAGSATKQVTTAAPPGIVTVSSSAGGSAAALVRVIAAAAPAAPANLVASAVASTRVTLGWADLANNETGFVVYSSTGGGALVQVASLPANTTTAVIGNLTANTTYTFRVDAVNTVGASSSNTLTVTTPVLPTAPTIGTAQIAPSPASRQVNLSFTDNSGDETGFRIERATAATGPWTAAGTVGPANGGVVTFLDPTLLNTSTSYFYRAVALRGVDESPASASTSVTTPAAPVAMAAPSFGAVSGSSITVNWATRAGSSATGYIVYRTPSGTANFQPITGVLQLTQLSLVDTTVTSGTTYQYRINAVGWASYSAGTNGVVSANVQAASGASLVAPSAATASIATRPVLGWIDQSSGETAYQVTRTPMTLSATTGAMTAGTTTTASSTITALATPATGGTMAFTEPTTQASNATIRYDIRALNGTTAGPITSVYTVTTALPTPATPTTQLITGGGIRLNWTASTTATVGGYRIDRCTGSTCTNFAQVGTVNGRSTTTFADTTATSTGTVYRYRLRALGGVGTGLVGAQSGTVTRTR